ncbi:MAG: LPS export ABC transporter periplasmic protein LptC [Alphaproteobacteria bacterium]
MSEEQEKRLSAITAPPRETKVSRGYSRTIKRVQLALPIAAFLLLGLIFGWNQFQTNTIKPVTQQYTKEQKISRNELINPKFDSLDDKSQPYELTATRAVQDAGDKDLLLLDQPTGNVDLQSGETLDIRGDSGTYRQDVQNITLNKNVIVNHSLGYVLNTETLNIDMKTSTARSNVDVNGEGPEGTIKAKGVEASSSTGTVIFHGPAKLTLTNTDGQNAFNFTPTPKGATQ